LCRCEKSGHCPVVAAKLTDLADIGCVTGRNVLRGLAIGLVSVIHGAGTDKVLQFDAVTWGRGG
jgi:hypothetical protein